MPPPPLPSHRPPQTPHQPGANVSGMSTARGAKRRSPEDPEEIQDKDGSPSGRKKPRISAAPHTPSAQKMNANGTPAATSSTMPPPPLPSQGGQQGPLGSGPQQPPNQAQQAQQAQTPQGQPPSTPQPRFMSGPTAGMGVGMGLGQPRPGPAGGPLGTMPSLAYPNPGVMNGSRVSMSGAPGVPGTPGVGGPGGMPMIPNPNPMSNQVGRGLSIIFSLYLYIREVC